jgi:Putative zinc-finger
MRCRRVEQLLSDRLERPLAVHEADAAAAHLRDCPACRRLAGEFAAAGDALRALAQQVSPPDLDRSVVERWLAEREAMEARQTHRGAGAARCGWLGVATAGVAGATVVALLLTGRIGVRQSPQHEVVSSRLISSHPAQPIAGRKRPAGPPKRPVNGPGNIGTNSSPREHLIYLNAARASDPRRRPTFSPGRRSLPAAQAGRPSPVHDDFVTIPLPRIAAGGPTADRAAAEAAAAYQREVAVVDTRLAHTVTLQQKATALADLCEHLRADTGIALAAGPSVADEKVTLFCKEQPLRDVMRQLSRPFGYTWLRSGKQGEYKYELVQDLRSQLLEEELRTRDRNAALLAMDDAMSRLRPYVGLPPDELRKRAIETGPAGPKLPKHLAGTGWGPLQLYSRLSPRDLAALRAGQKLSFSAAPGPGAQQLPPDLIRGVLESVHDRRIRRRGDAFDVGPESALPDGLPPASVPEARAMVTLQLDRSELGQLTLVGQSGFFVGTPPDCPQILGDDGPIAVGVSPTVRDPENAAANARLARDAALRPPMTVRPRSSCAVNPSPLRGGAGGGVNDQGGVNKFTTADVLEALHRTTGLPVVADYYTRLYPDTAMAVRNMPLFDALNRLADTMRMRWTKADGWLQLRSTSFFNDRLKEVPNRFLTRWMASRQEHGALTLDDLVEIAQLSDAQLDSDVIAEGAETCLGLAEWKLARNGFLRPFWRFLAMLTPAQRLQAASATGLPFRQMTLAQQQQFIALAVPHVAETMSAALEDLGEASVRLDYRLPGSYEWKVPTPAGGAGWRGLMPSPVRERNREEALRAARRIDARADETQIVPTELTVTMIYALGGPNARFTPLVLRADPHNTLGAPSRKSTAGS